MLPANKEQYLAECKRREEGIDKVCTALHTTRMYICDLLTLGYNLLPSIDPIKVEKWISKHCCYNPDKESIKDFIIRMYGREIAELMETLF